MGRESEQAVDIVYLWVDGNDPTWRLKRQQAAAKLSAHNRDAMAVYGNVEGRFRDNDELRCNLRALEKYFPDHGHVYLVTDGQTPTWLCASKRLTVIDHRDLIPGPVLPTFDSGNIESYIHRIPQLSERYIYLNDDVFFGGPVDLDHWFWDGGVYAGWSDEPWVSDEPMREDATSLANACRLSQQWLRAHASEQRNPAYTHTARTFAHSPRAMRKSVVLTLEAVAPELFEAVRSTVFRTWNKPTLISDFVMRWSLANGFAKIRDYAHMHVSTGETASTTGLDALAASLGALDFFCINDTTDDAHRDDPRLVQVREALQRMFSQPSGFERTHAG